MKVACLMSMASPQSRDIALQIAESGNELHVVDAWNLGSQSYVSVGDAYQLGGLRVLEGVTKSLHRVPYRGIRGGFSLLRRLARILRHINPDVLLTIHGGTFALAAYASGFRPYVVYVGGSDVLFGGFGKRSLSRMALTGAEMVFANGRHLAQKTEELAPRARVTALYMGTDTVKFRPGERVAVPISIVCTRGFLPIYNNELLIRALKHLPEDLPAYEVTFAAAGPELEKARALADEILPAAQRERVKFLGGASRETLAELLSKAHIYVSVSLSDGTSLSLMEAMACGAFPVLSDIPANREWVEPTEKNGLLVSCDDEAGLAEALAKAMQDEALRAAAGTKNRQLILERADLRANMQKMVQELVGCVKEHRKLAGALRSSRLPVE